MVQPFGEIVLSVLIASVVIGFSVLFYLEFQNPRRPPRD